MDITATQIFSHPFRASVVGASGSGKSHMLANLI